MNDVDYDAAAEAACREFADEQLAEKIDSLSGEIESLRKDAERYRWLRDKAHLRSRDLFNAWWMSENGHPENVEAAIDIAMAATKEQAE